MKAQAKYLLFAMTGAALSLQAVTAAPEDTYAPNAPNVEKQGRILIITEDDYNDTELFYPLYRFVEEGYEVDVTTLSGEAIAGYNTAPLKSTLKLSELNPKAEDYVGLYLPGGHAPQKLRKDEQVLAVVKDFAESGKPIGAICHGPQILMTAGLLEGKNVAVWPGIEEEVVEYGGTFVNEPVVLDGRLVTARMPGDLPAHLHAFFLLINAEN